MAISIPNRNDKLASQIRDAIRILAWQEYKADNKSELKGLDLYEVFKEEWESHKIHKMNLNQLQKFIADFGYTQADLVHIRGEYYRNKQSFNPNNNSTHEEGLENAPF